MRALGRIVSFGWRTGLCLCCLALLGWLWGETLPVAAQGPPDLTVEGDGSLGMPGGEVTYRIRLLNWRGAIVPNGVISHTLPTGFKYVLGSTQVTVGGWPVSRGEPRLVGDTLVWGPFRLPAAGHTAHNPYGVHTFVQDLCVPEFIDFQLDQALTLVGSGGYVTQLFYRITPETSDPEVCAIYFVNAAYDRNLVPILRLQGTWNQAGFWEKPAAGPRGDYAEIADAFARYVAGLPRRNSHPLYVTIWNEPDLWVEWSGRPNAQEYGRFFVAVANAIRRLGDPRIRILNGAVTPANTTFIRQLMTVPGFATSFDAWASHCYPYNHPPWYNIHYGTARYGNAVIDCYLEERDSIARYGGRKGFKFVVKETGYGLGEKLYAFEGFARINQSNRATFISMAFDKFWRAWPEVIAVTPFELGDPWNGWEWLDWIDYSLGLDPFHFNYVFHPQYNTVAALAKPRGTTVPHSFEVSFRAQIAKTVSLGPYFSQLSGTAGDATITVIQAAPVRVVAEVRQIYLPLVRANTGQRTGVWTMQAPSEDRVPHLSPEPLPAHSPGNGGDGTIVPTHFLVEGAVGQGGSQASWQVDYVSSGTEPRLMALDERWGHAFIGLSGGELIILDLSTLTIERRIPLEAELEAIAPGSRAGMVYAALSSGQVMLWDAVRGELIARTDDLSHPNSLVFEPQTGTLLVADAGRGEIVRFRADLSARLQACAVDDLPGRMLLDMPHRRTYVMLPGARRVLALDTDSLELVGAAQLAGGPLIDLAFDSASGQVYVLSALSPRYRGITVLRSSDMAELALVAGSPSVPLRLASALTVLPERGLLLAEGTQLYQVAPEDLSFVARTRIEYPVGNGGLVADRVTGRIAWLGPAGVWIAQPSAQP